MERDRTEEKSYCKAGIDGFQLNKKTHLYPSPPSDPRDLTGYAINISRARSHGSEWSGQDGGGSIELGVSITGSCVL